MIKKLTLEFFSREFLDRSLVWCNDPIIQKLIDGVSVTKEQQEKWYNSLQDRPDYRIWGVSCNGVPIGACGLKGLTQYKGDYWGYIGEKDYWGGVGSQLVSLVEEKAKELKLKRIYMWVLHDNHRAKHLYERLNYIWFKDDDKFAYYYKDIEKK